MKKKHPHKKKVSFTKKWSAKLHLWFGLSVGIIVFIVSLTGTLYVFKDEIQNSLRKEAMYVKETTASPLSIAILKEKVSLELNEKFPVNAAESRTDFAESTTAYGDELFLKYALSVSLIFIFPETGL